ncbi:MAG: aspartyl-tRNA(Asn)/glutamyl-tRNA(Gln) amidotransferase subunit [Actinomycetota bacterium]|jgi:aspartyl-tRNA(Asn)/glutamyl-tRNA(Gln) amidotransferase subunit B|nr:aspartyl-tRNA(Asn)/glutamyl-tRNA(Gln) amidotransferase subunit [Actinomycetota bacterium]
MSGWETVIGLEVHCELATRTKLFCSCRNDFGAEPNTYVCPVCLGLPGSLPVLNERAVEFALRVGEALHCDIPEESIFHRKNYFYPDMPKNFQISQYDEPVCGNGWLAVPGPDGTAQRVGVERAHLEEDTGKTSHVGGGGGRIHGADHSLVDYNRAGVPLLEIVSKPDLRSAEGARAYVAELRGVLEAIGVSDVKMEEGSLRIDANISLRPAGSEKLGTRAEIKNMNSLRSLVRALEYEAGRQADVLEAGEAVVQETRHWDEDAGRTYSLRSKEEAYDYRYFPEPDLVPLSPSAEWREQVRAAMPELPAARKTRLVEAWGISDVDAGVLVGTPGLADYAEAAVAASAAGAAGLAGRDVTNWVTGDLLANVRETGAAPAELALSPGGLAELVGLVADGTLSRPLAKEVLGAALSGGGSPAAIVAERGLAQVSDEGSLEAAVAAVLATHPAEVERYRSGEDKDRKKLRGFFMGKVMAEMKGRGNPQVLNRLLDEALGAPSP